MNTGYMQAAFHGKADSEEPQLSAAEITALGAAVSSVRAMC